jgi:7-cyano-7-deazaguanine synthase in queuosine biosynthesis
MPAHVLPYSFSFRGGISRRGIVDRSSPYISGGFRHRLAYRFVDNRLLAPLGCRLTPEAADLIDVCVAITICDRRGPRNSGQIAWLFDGIPNRSFEISILVRRPDLWNRIDKDGAVSGLFNLLSGDEATVRFEQRVRDPRPAELQLPLLLAPPADDAVVLLHSGGLDSLLGMAHVLASNEHSQLVPVSMITHTRIRRVVEEVSKSLEREFPYAQFRGSQLALFQHDTRDHIDDRATEYRTRILPCLAAGVVVAAALGSSRHQLTENGPGAINLPTSFEQLDSWTTRATHPKTLAAFELLASLALDREVRIDNIGLPHTKGQLALVLRDKRFEDAARRTVSCERFPYARSDSPCGRCTSCLYRQAALQRVGMAHIDSSRSGQDSELECQAVSPGRSVAATALAEFVAQLNALLSSDDPYRALDAEYPRIDEVRAVTTAHGISDESVQQMIVDLYREFSNEIGSFLGAEPVAFPQQSVRAVAS